MEGGALRKGASARTKGAPQGSLALFVPCEDTARDQQSARGRWNQEKVAEAGCAGPGTRLKILIFILLLDTIGVTKGVSMEVTSPRACFEKMSRRLWEEVPDKALWEAECGCRNRVLGVTGGSMGAGEGNAVGRLRDLAHFLSRAGSREPHFLTASKYPGDSSSLLRTRLRVSLNSGHSRSADDHEWILEHKRLQDGTRRKQVQESPGGAEVVCTSLWAL